MAMNKTPFETYGALKVTGSHLTNLDGKIVQLRGLSTHNLTLYPEYVNEKFLLQARDEWNVNLIRLAMYTDEENGYCTGDEANKERLFGYVVDGVKLADKLGMYIIIDWHILFDSNPLIYKEEAKIFWDRITSICKDYKHVIYEICNEPNVDANWADIKTYSNEILPIIRKNDPDAVILIGTPVWSQRVDEAQADPVTGFDNLMYVLHFYADSHKQDLRDVYKAAYEKNLPIFVSEFGAVNANGNGSINIEEADAWLDMLNEDETSYCIWNLSNKDEASAFFLPNCDKICDFKEEDLREQAIWYINRLK